MAAQTEFERRYDIDWVRVIAIGLLLLYHTGIGFQPWGVFIGFIQSDEPLKSLWVPMSMLNLWRIPLLFFVSGMGVCFAMRKRNWKELMIERSRRILLPLIFGAILIVPLHTLLWQKYYMQELSYIPAQSHLWFLTNIMVYIVVLSPLFFYLKLNRVKKPGKAVRRFMSKPVGLAAIILANILEVIIVKPDTFETYSMSMHGYILGLIAFLSGYLLIYSGEEIWDYLVRIRWVLLAAASTLFMIRYLVFDLRAPLAFHSLESNIWIFTAFGFARRYLVKPSPVLSYLNTSAYPVYILHMVFLYAGSYLVFPLEINTWLKFAATSIFTLAGCFVSYEFIIRRTGFLRPLFGLRPLKSG